MFGRQTKDEGQNVFPVVVCSLVVRRIDLMSLINQLPCLNLVFWLLILNFSDGRIDLAWCAVVDCIKLVIKYTNYY